MRYQFRALPPNADLVMNHSGEGYVADDEQGAWAQLTVFTKSTVEMAQRRYTIEVMP